MINGTETVVNNGASDAGLGVPGNKANDLIGITQDRDVGVVAREDDLPPSLVSQTRNDVLIDESIV